MRFLKKTFAMIRYKKEMKKVAKQIASMKEVYERNERLLEEARELIALDAAMSK